MYSLRTIVRHHPALCCLVAVNLTIWTLLRLVTVVSPAAGVSVLQACELPCSLGGLMHRPWTLLTYFWVHTDGWHLMLNMLCLWYFGLKLPQGRGWKAQWLYMAGGVGGGVLYSLAGAAPGNMLIGSSAAVLAIAVAVTAVIPKRRINMPVLGHLYLWWITAALLSVDVVSVAFGDYAGHVAHLGGALTGLCAGWQMRRWKFRTIHPTTTLEHSDISTEQILSKIRRSGHGSLTPEERRILFKVSQGK